MLHLDLFSGIGGFAYAVDQVWDNAEHIFCDNDKFCQAVLKKHWPESVIYDDIKDITDTTIKGLQRGTGQKQRRQDTRPTGQVGLLTGGFPCQPFSAAGVRRGTSDERYLWPEMFRVIRLSQPQWVIAENVRGLLTWENGLVFEQVCTDLESEGYEVWPFIIPALAVNAPHRRDRIWWVATNTKHPRQGRKKRGSDGTPSKIPQEYRAKDGATRELKRATGNRQNDRYDANPERKGWERQGDKASRQPRQFSRTRSHQRQDWNKDWPEVATELCSVDDGLPAELGETTISKAKHRAEQLKAYGNAIVPAVAVEIMKGIKESNLGLRDSDE